MPPRMAYPPSGLVRDLGPLPDEAVPLIPALIDSLGSFPQEEQHGRACAAMVLLAREHGLWGARELSMECTTLGDVVVYCLRILLTTHSSQQSASTAWAALLEKTRQLSDFPAASPPRRAERHQDPRPRSPSPSPSPPAPTNITISDVTGLLRAISSATAQENALADLVAELRHERAPTTVTLVCGMEYCFHRDDHLAPRLSAAVHSLRRLVGDLQQGRLPPRPFSVAASAAASLMSAEGRALFLAEEWLAQTEPPFVVEALRLARLTRPTSAFEAEAWRRGTAVHAPHPTVATHGQRQAPKGFEKSSPKRPDKARDGASPKNVVAPAPRAGPPRH